MIHPQQFLHVLIDVFAVVIDFTNARARQKSEFVVVRVENLMQIFVKGLIAG
ncbi:hypothetical protein D3C72_1993960 [compost metagenome]